MKTFAVQFVGYFRTIFGMIQAKDYDEALDIAQNELDRIKEDDNDSYGFDSASYDDIVITEVTETGYTFVGSYSG